MREQCWEVEGTACAKALSRRPQLPLCSLRGLTGLWGTGWTVLGPSHSDFSQKGQSASQLTLAGTAVHVAHVSDSSLASMPLKSHFVFLVFICVFLFKEKQL